MFGKQVAMTDREQPIPNAAPIEGPLFQGQEQQEQVYSPQQVPGANIPPVERDADGSAAQRSAVATDPDTDTTTATDDANRSYG
jgi:hypothetical protein